MDQRKEKKGLIALMRPFLRGKIRPDGRYEPPSDEYWPEENAIYRKLYNEYLRDLASAQRSVSSGTINSSPLNIRGCQSTVGKPSDIHRHADTLSHKLGPEGTHLVDVDGSYSMGRSTYEINDPDKIRHLGQGATSTLRDTQQRRQERLGSSSVVVDPAKDGTEATEVACTLNDGHMSQPQRPGPGDEHILEHARHSRTCHQIRPVMGDNTIDVFARELEKALEDPEETVSD